MKKIFTRGAVFSTTNIIHHIASKSFIMGRKSKHANSEERKQHRIQHDKMTRLNKKNYEEKKKKMREYQCRKREQERLLRYINCFTIFINITRSKKSLEKSLETNKDMITSGYEQDDHIVVQRSINDNEDYRQLIEFYTSNDDDISEDSERDEFMNDDNDERDENDFDTSGGEIEEDQITRMQSDDEGLVNINIFYRCL